MSSSPRDLVIRIRGDSVEFVAAVDGANKRLDGFEQRIESIDRSSAALTGSIARMGHYFTAFLGARELIQAADAYSEYASRMRMATESAAEFEYAQSRMASSASETFRSINETRESFILMNPVLRQMGLSLDESIDAIDTFSGLLVVNAASTERATSAQGALSKALQTGRVESDGWQSMLAAMPSLVGTLATSSGLAEAEIRKLGISGQLSVDMLTQALVDGNSAVMGQVRQMPTTIADALTNLNTAFAEYVGKTDQAWGLTAGMAEAIGGVSEHFTSFANAAIVAAAELHAAAELEAAAAILQAKGELPDVVRSYQALAKARRDAAQSLSEQSQLTRAVAEKQANIDAARAAADNARAAEDEWRRTAESIEQSLTDALLRGFESDKYFGENPRGVFPTPVGVFLLRLSLPDVS